MPPVTYGFVGLGNMGGPMAANLAKAGIPLAVFDKAGTAERAPADAVTCESVAAVAGRAAAMFVSVPDGADSLDVARSVAGTADRSTSVIIDLSTIGIDAAKACHGEMAAAGITYIDAPVSGGRAGAVAASISLMWAGPLALLGAHRPVIEKMTRTIFHVGEEPGQGQAMKLLNNFLSATALTATSEAVLVGLAHGLDMQTVLDVLNASSGKNAATSDKFPNHVLTGTFDAGFRTALMSKDVALYAAAARAASAPREIGETIERLWKQACEAMPDSDFTAIYRFVAQGEGR